MPVPGLLLTSLGLLTPLAVLAPRWLPSPPPGNPIAIAERAGRILVGTDLGLYGEEGTGWSLLLARRAVRDVAHGERATLIAAGGGLYEWPLAEPEPRRVQVGAGARVRSVAVDAHGGEWVATEVGLFLRPPGALGFERDTSLPAGEVVAVRATARAVWAAMRGVLRVRRGGAVFQIGLQQLESGWWELLDVLELDFGTLLCVPGGLWRLGPDGAERVELGIGALSGVAREDGILWVASERGLYRMPLAELERAAPLPELDGRAVDVSVSPERILVATQRGVATLPARGTRSAGSPPSTPGLRAAGAEVSDVRRLQRAVLSYLELGPRRLARLEESARRAPLLPVIRATLSAEADRGRSRERDQAFTSGSTRDLIDHDSESASGLGLQVQLTWDLDELLAPDRALAVSRERRELIELRDQVLDRVNRLYFERLRVLARLRALDAGPEHASERAELEIRSRELAAGLDAWSGGLFSRLEESSPP
jgi:ligand-binding sensor domain-containing protein